MEVCAGQTEDSSTHLDTWNTLRKLVGRADFLYVADSKLCTHAMEITGLTKLPRHVVAPRAH